jgi:hypothetical protein
VAGWPRGAQTTRQLLSALLEVALHALDLLV